MSLPEYTRLRWKLEWNKLRGSVARRLRRLRIPGRRREEQLEFRW